MAKQSTIKITAALLAVIIAFSVFTIVPIKASAATDYSSELEYIIPEDEAASNEATPDEATPDEPGSYLEYTILYNGTAEITGYTGSPTALEIPSELDGYTVTSIGNSAFEGCSSLTSINIPDGVTSIGAWAFERCSSLTSINIPDGVTRIGNYAFMGCSSLTSINIPDGVTSIGEWAFYNCTSLTSLTIPDSVTSIGNSAFNSCSSLTRINIPDGVTSIGNNVFQDCSSLTRINIPDSVTSIGNSAFHSCSSLTSINIPDGVTSIGNWAFYSCSSLTSINIPDGVTSIGNSAFYNTYKLTDVLYSGSKEQWNSITIGSGNFGNATIHYNAEYIKTVAPDCANKGYDLYSCSECEAGVKINFVDATGNHEFVNGVCTVCGDNTNFSYRIMNTGTVEITGYNATSTEVEIPSEIKGYRVTSIDDSAFEGCSSLTSINIPDGVTSIGNYVFQGCSSLTSINIPDGVTSIGEGAFGDCSSLTSINIPNGVTSIGEWTFYYCSSLTSINIPDGVTSIGERAFGDCSSLTSINIPNGVTSIGDYAFCGCSSLTSINIPDGVTSIGGSAFYYCSSLANVNIPNGVTSIGEWAFAYCSSLTSINIPDGVTSIGNEAFNNTYNLSDVLYSGSKEQWNSITIGSYNFENATIHYNAEYTKTVAPDCINKGYDLYSCSECEDGVKINFTESLGHNFVDGICERCGKDELDCIQSLHPYENYTDENWTIYKENAKRIAVIFSEETKTESGCDCIYIYNKDNEEIGRYSGTVLSGKRIVVQGDTVKIRLTSDGSVTYYGFSVSDIVPYYEDCSHTSTEIRNSKAETCGEDGYTGDLFCTECETVLETGEIITATGNHEFKNGVCSVCGHIDLDCLEQVNANVTKNVEINNPGEYKYFKFTPSVNGTLNFYSTGSNDTYGYLYDSQMNELTSDDDSGENNNFNISYSVIAGETYVLGCRLYYSDICGTFDVVVNFEPDTPSVLFGDVNQNGDVDIMDVTLIQMYLANNIELSDEQLYLADVDNDGSVTISDATQIQKYIAQIITFF